MPYRSLNEDNIKDTLETLRNRIEERFPKRGLGQVCQELLEIAPDDARRARSMRRPNLGIRVLVWATIIAGLAGVGWGIWQKIRLFGVNPEEFNSFEGVEAIVNIIILMGAGIWFLLNLETRIKRERVLEDLHQLRSIAHVIDMHQLTKDPTAVLNKDRRTKSSPVRDMTAFELMRYLDYCAEMLSLTGKLAALYMQGLRDPVVIQSVNEIEDLTTNLSRKIWQKIMTIQGLEELMVMEAPGMAGATGDGVLAASKPSTDARIGSYTSNADKDVEPPAG